MGRAPQSAKTSQLVRLNKFIADCGLASRRGADQLIRNGKVLVNGIAVRELGTKVHPARDRVSVAGKNATAPKDKVYIMFHKPKNVLTALSDPEGRPVVGDFFRGLRQRVFPVGKLDWDTEGLVLLTNDGDFAQAVIHPEEEIPKTYLAKVNGHPSPEQLTRLMSGVPVVGGKMKPTFAKKVRVQQGSQAYDWVKIVVNDGTAAQIHQMFAKIGFDVKKLQRIAIGQLTLGKLQRGDHMFLSADQVLKIFEKRREERRPKTKE